MQISRGFALPVIGLSLILTTAACSRESAQTQPATTESPSGSSTAPASPATAENRDHALVRVVNAMPGTTAVDVIADETPTFSQVEFKTVTPYREVPATADDFAIRPSGAANGTKMAENSEAIVSGKHYTLIAFPGARDEKASLEVVNDDLVPPSTGKARVRVIQAAPTVEAVDIYATGKDTPLFDDVDFKETAGYQEVDPANLTLAVRDANNGKKTLATPEVKIEPGKSYTLIVTGGPRGVLDAIVVEDFAGARQDVTN